jgi:hypothetical protein
MRQKKRHCAIPSTALEATGSPVITDGEQTKPSFATCPLSGLENLATDAVTIPFLLRTVTSGSCRDSQEVPSATASTLSLIFRLLRDLLTVGPIGHAHDSRHAANQPVERAATLEDIRAEVLTPDRLNSLVFGLFATVALLIAVVGVAGVLAFSVSARTREFGIRLASDRSRSDPSRARS